MAILLVVAQAGGGQLGPGWNLIVLHHTPGAFLVTGLVYDVTTGRVETVVAPALLRP